jgi:HemY protein
MRSTLWFLLKLAILVAAAIWIADRPGHVSFDWLGWRVDTSVGVLLAALLLLMALAAIVYRFWGIIVRGPRRLRERRHERQRLKGYRALTQGMVAVAAGDADEAKRQARIAHGLLSEPPLTLLLAAQAAQLSGDETAARRYFTAMLERPETAFLGMRGLLNQALAKGDTAQALKLAAKAHEERPQAGWAAKALLDLELKQGEWVTARRTAKAAEKLKVIDRDRYRRIEGVTLLEQARLEPDPVRATALARDAARLLPDFVPTLAIEARVLAQAGREREAEKILEKAWTRGLGHPALANAYAALKPNETALDRARRFERLTQSRPEATESRLTLAETAIAAGLWGPARKALEAVAAAERAAPSGRLCRLMARLEEGEHGDLAAARRWLMAAAEAPSDPAWVCSHCGATAADWAARCGHCGEFDSLAWKEGARVLLALGGTAEPRASEARYLPPAAAPVSPSPAAAAGSGETKPADSAAPIDAARLIT